MKIAVLYTRLTSYWMACMRHDVRETSNQYLVIRNKPSDQAPFIISSEDGIEIINGDDLDPNNLATLIQEFKPDLSHKIWEMAFGPKGSSKLSKVV